MDFPFKAVSAVQKKTKEKTKRDDRDDNIELVDDGTTSSLSRIHLVSLQQQSKEGPTIAWFLLLVNHSSGKLVYQQLVAFKNKQCRCLISPRLLP